MLPRVMQYLLYETGGLTSYLVGQPTLRDCFLKGYPMERLKRAAADAELVVGFNTTWMLPKSANVAVTLECDELEALRMVLCGIATIFSNPLVCDKIQDSFTFANCKRHGQWDDRLDVVTAGGPTPLGKVRAPAAFSRISPIFGQRYLWCCFFCTSHFLLF